MTEDMVKLEAAVGDATSGLMAITTITREFTETAGLMLVDVKGLKALFDGVINCVTETKENKPKRRRRTQAELAAAKPSLVAPRGGDSIEEVKKHDAKVKEEVNEETGEVTTRDAIPSIQSPAPKKKAKGKVEPEKMNGKVDPTQESLFD